MLSLEDFFKEVGDIIYPDMPDKTITLDTRLDEECVWDSLSGVQFYNIIDETAGDYHEHVDVIKHCQTVGDLWEFYKKAVNDNSKRGEQN